MNIKPLGDRVLVRMVESPKETPGGIILPDRAQPKSQLAKVVAVGPGLLEDKVRRPIEIAVGSTVLLGYYLGEALPNPNESMKLVREDEILATVEENVQG